MYIQVDKVIGSVAKQSVKFNCSFSGKLLNFLKVIRDFAERSDDLGRLLNEVSVCFCRAE